MQGALLNQPGDFFIVDNSDKHWKALEYVRQWCEISESIDVATGHFEIGALLALDGEWQKVDKLRLLIGGDTSAQTVAAVAAGLDESFVVERGSEDPFLSGAPAIVDAIRSGKIEIRVYRKKKFHAKSYITHGRLDVVGSAALVGSSNFTRPGLTRNVELNVRFSGPEVRELQAWFESYWNEAEPVNEEILSVITRNTREFSPFEIYARSLQVLTSGLVASGAGWEQTDSRIFPLLDPYQREAYHGLRHMAEQWNGGFLTDGVGLGKTFVGLMLAEYYAVHERKNVLVMAPKTGQEAVWIPEIERHLPDLAGGDFSSVLVKAHTDLSKQDAPELVSRLRDRVDVVIIDEAHNFRNHGRKGDDVETVRSRWWRMEEICRGKTVFLLTATPINNSLFDLVHEAEMFTGMADDYFASVGVSSINGYMRKLEKPFNDIAKAANIDAPTIDLTEFEALLRDDQLLKSIIWQNSRKYAMESAKAAGGGDVLFPELAQPHAVNYDLTLHHGNLLLELEKAFEKQSPLFVLPMYYPLAFSNSAEVDTIAENRQRQVVGLIRTTFLKRFESSVAAFAGSCLDLAAKIQVWLDANGKGDAALAHRLEQWKKLNEAEMKQAHDRYRPTQAEAETTISDDITEAEFEELDSVLDPGLYDLETMVNAAFDDLDQLVKFVKQINLLGSIGDDKYLRLKELIDPAAAKPETALPKDVATPELKSQKVLVFTEFADTARYLHTQLVNDGLTDIDRLDGSRTGDRVKMIKRFAPFYNKVTDEERDAQAPLRVLISTDVLSEGVNLQDSTLIINYDLHWNPVRLMQRIGRVDRRMNAETEAALVKAHPSAKKSRGNIQIRNFMAPDALERLLRLNQRIHSKVLRISKTLGIPGGKLLTDEDVLEDVKVMQAFKDEYEGSLSPIEQLRLKYQQLLLEDPGLEERLGAIPIGAHSGKKGSPRGVFACRMYPRAVKDEADGGSETIKWVLDGGPVEWSIATPDGVLRDLIEIDRAVESDPSTHRTESSDRNRTGSALRELEKESSARYLKQVQLPLNAPRPRTICWMDVQ